MTGQGFGDCSPGNVSQLSELVQSVRTGIDIIVLKLIGGRMSARGIVDLIEAVDVPDLNDRSRRPAGDR
jgi:hypothetical protein